jgi:hypothetical protein
VHTGDFTIVDWSSLIIPPTGSGEKQHACTHPPVYCAAVGDGGELAQALTERITNGREAQHLQHQHQQQAMTIAANKVCLLPK